MSQQQPSAYPSSGDAFSPPKTIGTTPSTTPNTANSPIIPQAQSQQPTVRVMRLYKPGMHTISTFIASTPNLPTANSCGLSLSSASGREAGCLSDYSISPFLLLPDSFGDIYMGEVFSAYVAVVNGMQDAPFHHVSLTLRLLATNATHDLIDTRSDDSDAQASTNMSSSGSNSGSNGISRNSSSGSLGSGTSSQEPIQGKTLQPNEFTDTVVKHKLTELGTHTLRVSVQYLSHMSTELKTLRKFYRFNVLQPLVVTSTCVDMRPSASASTQLLVQCKVTNSTQSPVYIEQTQFVPVDKSVTVEPVMPPCASSSGDDSPSHVPDNSVNLDSLPLLQPEESYAYSFIVTRPENWRLEQHPVSVAQTSLGYPLITWCSYMGEHATVQGSDTFLTPPDNRALSVVGSETRQRNASQTSININSHIQIINRRCPTTAVVGKEFSVEICCKNCTSAPVLMFLQNQQDGSAALPNISSMATGRIAQYKSNCNGLCVTGLTGSTLGLLQPGETIDTSITVFPLSCGLFDLCCLAAVDRLTGMAYSSGSLGAVLVQDQ